MTKFRISRHHDIFRNIFLIRFIFDLRTITQLYNSLRMCKSCCCPENKGSVKLFTQFKRRLKKIFCLRTVRRFNHRNLSGSCNHPRILFVLRTVKSRIICNNKNKSSVYSHIRNRIQRICRHIQTDMLHACHRTYSGKTCSDRHFCRHFFIRRPLFIHIIFILYKVFTYLGTRSSRISRRYLYPCFVCSSRNRLIAEHDHFLCHIKVHPFVNLLLSLPYPQTVLKSSAPQA